MERGRNTDYLPNVKNKRDFVLDGMNATSKLSYYNPLVDPHLQSYFYNTRVRKHLIRGHIVYFESRCQPGVLG